MKDLKILEMYKGDIKEEVKTSDKTEKIFREVIATIKEGEIWESKYSDIALERIEMTNNQLKFCHDSDYEDALYINIGREPVFELKRREYTFSEAFELYEQGKEIESCDTRYKKVDGKDCYWYEDEKFWDDRFCGFSLCDIRGKWYINN